jgi:hypothetical protein
VDVKVFFKISAWVVQGLPPNWIISFLEVYKELMHCLIVFSFCIHSFTFPNHNSAFKNLIYNKYDFTTLTLDSPPTFYGLAIIHSKTHYTCCNLVNETNLVHNISWCLFLVCKVHPEHQSHPYRIRSKFSINTVVSPDDGHTQSPETYGKNEHIKKNRAPSWLYLKDPFSKSGKWHVKKVI